MIGDVSKDQLTGELYWKVNIVHRKRLILEIVPVILETMMVAAPRFQYPGSRGAVSFNKAGTALAVRLSAKKSKVKNTNGIASDLAANLLTLCFELEKVLRSQELCS